MARAYDIAVSALALDVDRKWLDNLTAHHPIPGVERFDRGVSRRLSIRALVAIAAARDLQRALGVSAARAVEIATRAVDASSHAVDVSPALSLRLDLGMLEREVERRLLQTMETAVPRRRGRPAAGKPPEARRGTR